MASRFTIHAGTTATATVAAGEVVRSVRVHSTAGGTLVITPGPSGSALPTITVPAAADWLSLEFNDALAELPAGTTFAFTGTDAYVITCTTGHTP